VNNAMLMPYSVHIRRWLGIGVVDRVRVKFWVKLLVY